MTVATFNGFICESTYSPAAYQPDIACYYYYLLEKASNKRTCMTLQTVNE